MLSLPAIAEQEETVAIGDKKFHRATGGRGATPGTRIARALQALQRQIGSDVFTAQYQQSPIPPGGGMIKRGVAPLLR